MSVKCPPIDMLTETLQRIESEQHDERDRELSDHLAHCEDCRRGLESLAGAKQWWQSARACLSKTTENLSAKQLAASICALSDGSRGSDNDASLLDHELEMLTPLLGKACHPELIGRLGRYELEQLVGRGGMGLVFRAFDTELQRIVAVKTLAIHLISIPSARERFVREARASGSIVHPHIVPVHDVITDGPVPAIVMQFIAGPTLEEWLKTRGPLPCLQALELASQIAAALHAAHEKGLVHRDVKPGNVLLEADGSRALLSDFGLVRALDDASLTRSGMLAGTPDYMSPEQARGRTVGLASDLFSFGSVFYTMLVGNPPFRSPEPMAVMNRICHEKHVPVSNEVAVSAGVERLINQLLAKDPNRRPDSAAFVSRRARQLLASETFELRKRSRLIRLNKSWLTVCCGMLAVLVLTGLGGWRWWFGNPISRSGTESGPSATNANVLAGTSASSAEVFGSASLSIEENKLDDQLRLVDTELRALEHELGGSTTRPERHNAENTFQHQLNEVDAALLTLEQELRLFNSRQP